MAGVCLDRHIYCPTTKAKPQPPPPPPPQLSILTIQYFFYNIYIFWGRLRSGHEFEYLKNAILIHILFPYLPLTIEDSDPEILFGKYQFSR